MIPLAPLAAAVSGRALVALTVGVAVLAAIAYVMVLRADLDSAETRAASLAADNARLADVANHNAAEAGRLQSEVARADAEATEARKAAEARAATINTLKRTIRHADYQATDCTPGNDDPVAAVLDSALDGLRGQSRPDGGDQDQGRAPADP